MLTFTAICYLHGWSARALVIFHVTRGLVYENLFIRKTVPSDRCEECMRPMEGHVHSIP
jgi:hypothetical protein